MKKNILTFILAAFCLAASANEVRYFTYQQMTRTVRYLNTQQELMIWCGYADEIETYCLVNEVWSEKVNQQYYEIWLYGFDAWTGEEIYMPLDLGCVWLQGAGNRFYNAATYLRFRSTPTLPSFSWYIPPYHPYERPRHQVHYTCTYHYHVHRPGWHHPEPLHNPYHCHEYYMRDPWAPIYFNPQPWHPMQERPDVSISHERFTNPRTTNTNGHANLNQSGVPSNRPVATTPSYGTYSRGTGSTTNSSGNVTPTPNRGTSTSTTTPSRGTSTTTTPSRGSSSTTTPSRGTSTTTPTRGTTTTSTPTRGTSTSSTTTPTRGTSTSSTTTPTRGTSTSSTTTPTRGTSTSSTTTPTRGTSATTPRSATLPSSSSSSNSTSTTPRTSSTTTPRQ